MLCGSDQEFPAWTKAAFLMSTERQHAMSITNPQLIKNKSNTNQYSSHPPIGFRNSQTKPCEESGERELWPHLRSICM